MSDQQPPSSSFARFRARVRHKDDDLERSPQVEAIHARVDQLGKLELRDVMTPRLDVAYLTIPVTPEAVADAVRDTGHSCFPVVNDDLDDVEGVLVVNDLFRSSGARRSLGTSLPSADEIARKIRRPPTMLPETMDLLEALAQMKELKRSFAVVIDEPSGVAGVVSVQDILEQIVGDLDDEFDGDDDPSIVRIKEGRWLIDGQTHVDEVEEHVGIVIPEGEYVTIAGFVLDLAGAIPSEGSIFHFGDWEFRVQSVEKRRISQIVLEYHEPVAPSEDEVK